MSPGPDSLTRRPTWMVVAKENQGKPRRKRTNNNVIPRKHDSDWKDVFITQGPESILIGLWCKPVNEYFNGTLTYAHEYVSVFSLHSPSQILPGYCECSTIPLNAITVVDLCELLLWTTGRKSVTQSDEAYEKDTVEGCWQSWKNNRPHSDSCRERAPRNLCRCLLLQLYLLFFQHFLSPCRLLLLFCTTTNIIVIVWLGCCCWQSVIINNTRRCVATASSTSSGSESPATTSTSALLPCHDDRAWNDTY